MPPGMRATSPMPCVMVVTLKMARMVPLFVMLGGVSAALVFVGLSIHARAVASDPLHRIRARNLTAGIVSVMVMSAAAIEVTKKNIVAGGTATPARLRAITALFA
jgi:hypothetical protein